MPYEDWLAAQGLVELQQLPLKDTKDEENESMGAKQIDSIHMTLDVIYKFIQDNTISVRCNLTIHHSDTPYIIRQPIHRPRLLERV